MAAGNEGAHSTWRRQGQSPAIVDLAGMDVAPVGSDGDVAD
jgi:hypothetical protein